MKWEIAVARILKISGIAFMLLDVPNIIMNAIRLWSARSSMYADGDWLEALVLKLTPFSYSARTLAIGFGAIGIALILERMSRREA